jgi:hypothetical protein
LCYVWSVAAQHSVHTTGGSLPVFKRFIWLKPGSGKMASPRPTHQRVTHTVRMHPFSLKQSFLVGS